MQPNSVFRTHTTLMISDEGHYEWIDQVVQSLLQIFVIVALQATVKMEIAVSHMAIAYSCNGILFFGREIRTVLNCLPCGLHALVVVLGLE